MSQPVYDVVRQARRERDDVLPIDRAAGLRHAKNRHVTHRVSASLISGSSILFAAVRSAVIRRRSAGLGRTTRFNARIVKGRRFGGVQARNRTRSTDGSRRSFGGSQGALRRSTGPLPTPSFWAAEEDQGLPGSEAVNIGPPCGV